VEEEDTNIGQESTSADGHRSEITTEARKVLAAKESRVLMWLRLVIFVLLAFISCLVCAAVYRSTYKNQIETFEKEFRGYGSRVIDYFHKTFERQLQAIDALSVQITSEARARGTRFPFVTLPDFEIRGSNIRTLSALPIVMWLPLVQEEDRAEWESYVAQYRDKMHSAALDEDFLQQARQDARFGITNGEIQPYKAVFPPTYQIQKKAPSAFVPAENNTGPYLVVWQQTATRPSAMPINYNILTHSTADRPYGKVLRTGLAAMDFASNLHFVSRWGIAFRSLSILLVFSRMKGHRPRA